jgi:hypothetical protein
VTIIAFYRRAINRIQSKNAKSEERDRSSGQPPRIRPMHCMHSSMHGLHPATYTLADTRRSYIRRPHRCLFPNAHHTRPCRRQCLMSTLSRQRITATSPQFVRVRRATQKWDRCTCPSPHVVLTVLGHGNFRSSNSRRGLACLVSGRNVLPRPALYLTIDNRRPIGIP